MKFLKLFILTSMVLFISCAAVNLDSIYMYDSPPNTPYEVIGNVAGTDEYLDDLIRDLRMKALKLGGDALVITYRQVTQTSGDEQKNNIMADVIKLKNREYYDVLTIDI